MRKSSDAAAQTLFVFSSQKPRKRYFLYCTFHKSFKGHPTVTLGSAIPEEKIGHFRAFLWPSAPVGARKSCTLIAAPLCDVANFRLFKKSQMFLISFCRLIQKIFGPARVRTGDLLRVKQTWWPLHYKTCLIIKLQLRLLILNFKSFTLFLISVLPSFTQFLDVQNAFVDCKQTIAKNLDNFCHAT